MRTFAIVVTGLLVVSGCNACDDFHVTAYKTVEGAESAPWPSGCLVTVESRMQRIKAVFNHKGDNVFWINDIGYTVRSAQVK